MRIFRNIFDWNKNEAESNPPRGETLPVQMNLEERMELRRQLLCETLKLTLHGWGVHAENYEYKVIRSDRRGHCYFVVIDLSADFMDSERGSQRRLILMGDAIAKDAMTLYNLVVVGVYWRVNMAIQRLEKKTLSKAPSSAEHGIQVPAVSLNTVNKVSSIAEQIVRDDGELASDLATSLPASQIRKLEINIGSRTYSTDLAPLMGSYSDSR